MSYPLLKVGSPSLWGRALEGLVAVNRHLIKRHNLPPLYKTKIVYREEPGTEHWRTAHELYQTGFGDCEDLSAYRIAELRNQGENAKPHIYKSGPHRWHAVLKRGDGRIEDPTKILKNREKGLNKMAGNLNYKFNRFVSPKGRKGYKATVTIPDFARARGQVVLLGYGESPADATDNALGAFGLKTISKVIDNPIVRRAAMTNPYTMAALYALKAISKLGRKKSFKKMFASVVKKGGTKALRQKVKRAVKKGLRKRFFKRFGLKGLKIADQYVKGCDQKLDGLCASLLGL